MTGVELTIAIVKILIFLIYILQMTPLGIWADRRQSAMIQDRVGPNRAVVYAPTAVVQGLLVGPPALLTAAAAYYAFQPVRGQLATDRMTAFFEIAVLITWLFTVTLRGRAVKVGPVNAFERWLTTLTPKAIVYTGFALHVVGFFLLQTISASSAVLVPVFGSLLVLVLIGTAIYAAARVPEGPIGIRLAGTIHSLADAMKLVFKEDFIPRGADRLLHAIAPIIALIPAVAVIAVIPFGSTLCFQDGGTPGWDWSDLGRLIPIANHSGVCSPGQLPVQMQIADMNVGILYLFAVAGTGVIGATLAGWSSNNKFSLLGGLRAASQMVSYEVAMGLSLCGLFMTYGSVRLLPMVEWQGANAWGIFVQPLGFFLFLAAMVAETKRVPFDAPEGESEIVAGYFVEYSGMKFGMFFMGEYMELFTSSALLTVLFLGGYQMPFLHPDGITVAFGDTTVFSYAMTHLAVSVLSVLIFFGKVTFVAFVHVFIRWTLPRFRYDQIMTLGWKILLPLSLGNILVTGIIILGIDAAGPAVAHALKIAADITQAVLALGMLAGAVVFVRFILEPAKHKTFIGSTTARFAEKHGGVTTSPQQA